MKTGCYAASAQSEKEITMGCTTCPQSFLAPWTRKHDKPGTPHIAQAPVIYYPQNLQDLICICKNRDANTNLHAAGSHWALSAAAVSDHSFIETHDWNEKFHAMGRTLYEVVPGCLADEFLTNLNEQSMNFGASATGYFVHVESGKRIYQLYSELDVGDNGIPGSLCELMKEQNNNSLFEGSWAFRTLGGAGGQTVIGALSTGTHGGDFDRPPIADSVVALHLVVDGGKHYWIEQSNVDLPFTDEAALRKLYGHAQYGGPGNFDVIYDDDVWSAAICQVGRFGVIYSAVLQVVPQYILREDLSLDTWENVRGNIADSNSDLFINPYNLSSQQQIDQQFLQIVINPIPTENGTTHVCGVTRRWTLPLGSIYFSALSPLAPVNWSVPGSPGNVAGRPERVGDIEKACDKVLNAPLFSKAGQSLGYSPDESGVTSFNMFDFACKDANFMDGIVSGIYTEIENFLSNNTVAIGGGLAAVIAAGAADTLLALAPELLAILAILAAFLAWLRNQGGGTLGQALNNLRAGLMGDPHVRYAGILIWRAIANEVFKSQQAPVTFSAISYAVMDTHDYTDISCEVNVRSVEVFFEAADPNLTAFVNRLLLFEIDQEILSGQSVAGYISLRFCGQTEATIGPEKFFRTCAVECAGLADDAGSTDFVNYAVALALDPNIKGVLHWGQQNDSTRQQIEFAFSDSPPGPPPTKLDAWRAVLSQLTDNGSLDGFSSDFTRRTGLEVV
jgi:hypothetical protein